MMRNLLISLAAAASALGLASPASAQATSQHYGYPALGYGVPGYGAPGYGFNYAHVQRLQMRIDRIQRRIERLDRRNILSHREARRLHQQAWVVEHRLRRAARPGLHPLEMREIERRVARLEQRVRLRAVHYGGYGPGYGPGYGYAPGYGHYGERDRDDGDRRRDRDDDDDDDDDDRFDDD